MSIKQTDRAQIQQFGSDCDHLFKSIQSSLDAMVGEIVEVDYTGENALAFKTKCVNHAMDFSAACSRAMQDMSQVISDQTSFIAGALGGSSITVEPPAITLEAPPVNADTSVERANRGPLEALKESVGSSCQSIEADFLQNQDNLIRLGDSGWIGEEYDQTLSDMTRLTDEIVSTVTDTRKVITTDITEQLNALAMG